MLQRSAKFHKAWFRDWSVLKGKCKPAGVGAVMKKSSKKIEFSRRSKYDLVHALRSFRVQWHPGLIQTRKGRIAAAGLKILLRWGQVNTGIIRPFS